MSKGLILIADDDGAIRTVLNQALGRAGYDVRATGTAAGLWRWIAAGDGALVITDVVLPDENGFDLLPRIKRLRPELPVVVMSAQNTILTAITAAERGAFDYLPKPFDLKELTAIVQRALASPIGKKKPPPDEDTEDRLPLIGRSAAMQEIYRVIARLTQTEMTVLIMGESGTGKDLVARALHDYGTRRRGPFVAINTATISKDLIEAELFGYERGAFAGDSSRGVGRFEEAEGGTLFLDEVGDMPLDAQTRLLRVLQQGEYTTVGGRVPVKTDVRMIAATSRDLRQMIQQGLFREDLYYRLNVVPLRIPPLRERSEDIPDLVRHFLHKAEEEEGLPAKRLEADGFELLKAHRWPGNVRELENMVRRLAVLNSGDTIPAVAVASELAEPRHVVPLDEVAGADPLSASVERHLVRLFKEEDGLPPPGLYDRVLREIERPLLSIALAATRGNQIRAAHILGLNRNTLRKKIRDLGLEVIRGIRAD